jgi:signal transduction histidine kinase
MVGPSPPEMMGSMDVREPDGAVAVAPPAMIWGARRQPVLQWTSTPWQLAGMVVAAVSWTFAAGAVALLLENGAAPGYVAYWVMDVLTAVVYGGVCLVMLPRSRHPVIWILVSVAVGCAISGFLTQYLGRALTHPEMWAPGWLWVMSGWIWIPGTYALIAILPWLVSPHRTPRWVHAIVALGVVAIGSRVLTEMTHPYVEIDNPLAVMPKWYAELTHTLGFWPDRLCVVLGIAGAARLAWIRLVSGSEGRGYGWLAWGQLFLAIAYLPIVFPVPDSVDKVATDFAGASLIAAEAFLPGALLVVVLGQKLWGIDVTVNRAVVWLGLSMALATSYALAAWFVQQQLSTSADVAAMAALALLLVVSQPLRTWIQLRADRLIYGSAKDPAALIDSLGSVAVTSKGAGGLDALAVTLANDLRLGSVEILDDAGDVVALAGDAATLGEGAHVVPLLVDGRRLGALRVAAPAGQTLDLRSLRLLEQIGGLVGTALELATVNERLNTATTRLVEVRQEERRMLRRDIHDGIGPALAGVGLGIAAAERRLDHDVDGTRDLLGELHEELTRRIQDIRLLSRSLLPAALDDGDLCGALEALGARFETAGLTVDVDCARLGELDTRHQIAIYHVASEALLNAHRHGRARHVVITVSGGDAGGTVLEVVDNGSGIEPDSEQGVGLRSMQERADEQGGSFQIGPGTAGRGTRLRMVLP